MAGTPRDGDGCYGRGRVWAKRCPVCRLPSVLLGDASGDLQEGDELARDAHLPSRSANIGEGQRPHPQARTHPPPPLTVLTQLTELAASTSTVL